MIRYMSIIGSSGKDVDKQIAHLIEEPIWFLDKNPLDVPYIKLDIKIVGKEERFKEQRIKRPQPRTISSVIKKILLGGWK